MDELKKKIKKLESSMNVNNQRLHNDNFILRQYLRSSTTILLEIGGGFITGYLLARKKSVLEVMRTFISLSFKAQKIHNKIKLFSSFII